MERAGMMSGLHWGGYVSVLADGQALGEFLVDPVTKSITLGTEDPGYGVVHVGLGYDCNIQTLRFDLAVGQSTIQYTPKNMKKAVMRVKESSGGWIGPNEDKLTLVKWRKDEDWQQPNALLTGDIEHVIKGTWDRDGRIYFRQPDPLPSTLLALITTFETGDR